MILSDYCGIFAIWVVCPIANVLLTEIYLNREMNVQLKEIDNGIL